MGQQKRERENGTENIFEEIMAENFPNVVNSRRLKKLSETQTGINLAKFMSRHKTSEKF